MRPVPEWRGRPALSLVGTILLWTVCLSSLGGTDRCRPGTDCLLRRRYRTAQAKQRCSWYLAWQESREFWKLLMNLLIIWPRPLWFWCRTQNSLNFHGPTLPMAQVMFLPRIKIIRGMRHIKKTGSLVISCKWEQSGCFRAQTLNGPCVEWGGQTALALL